MEVIRNIHDNIYFDVKKINIIKEYYISRKEIKGLIAMSCIIANRKVGEKKKTEINGTAEKFKTLQYLSYRLPHDCTYSVNTFCN